MAQVIITFSDLERPVPGARGRYWPDGIGDPSEPSGGTYLHSESTWVSGDPGSVIIYNSVYQNNTIYGGLIKRTEEEENDLGLLYWHYELLDHAEHLNTDPIEPSEELAYYDIPYPVDSHEHVPDHDANSDEYGSYYPFMLAHIEMSEEVLCQGLTFKRPVNNGDNFKRIYMNGVSWMEDLIVAIGSEEGPAISEEDLLGVACIPGTDRLNIT